MRFRALCKPTSDPEWVAQDRCIPISKGAHQTRSDHRLGTDISRTKEVLWRPPLEASRPSRPAILIRRIYRVCAIGRSKATLAIYPVGTYACCPEEIDLRRTRVGVDRCTVLRWHKRTVAGMDYGDCEEVDDERWRMPSPATR